MCLFLEDWNDARENYEAENMTIGSIRRLRIILMKIKKGIAAPVCVAMAAVPLTGIAAENEVDISLVIGDNTASINGVQTEVTAPYIVNDTTLVPLRVISEGLGAGTCKVGRL